MNQDGAVDVRRKWMRLMGLSDEEIAEDCFAAVDLAGEVAEYNAMCDIQTINRRPKRGKQMDGTQWEEHVQTCVNCVRDHARIQGDEQDEIQFIRDISKALSDLAEDMHGVRWLRIALQSNQKLP